MTSKIYSQSALFITFEGVDGCGKTTQAQLLHKAIQKSGKQALLTREPGGTQNGNAIRKILLNGPPERWTPQSELLLFFASRYEHWSQKIKPFLCKGSIVICDRFTDSTRAYQGFESPDMMGFIDILSSTLFDREPDLTFYIRCSIETLLKRQKKSQGNFSETRFESQGRAKSAQRVNNYDLLAEKYPQRFCIIDGEASPEIVHKHVIHVLSAKALIDL